MPFLPGLRCFDKAIILLLTHPALSIFTQLRVMEDAGTGIAYSLSAVTVANPASDRLTTSIHGHCPVE